MSHKNRTDTTEYLNANWRSPKINEHTNWPIYRLWSTHDVQGIVSTNEHQRATVRTWALHPPPFLLFLLPACYFFFSGGMLQAACLHHHDNNELMLFFEMRGENFSRLPRWFIGAKMRIWGELAGEDEDGGVHVASAKVARLTFVFLFLHCITKNLCLKKWGDTFAKWLVLTWYFSFFFFCGGGPENTVLWGFL